ncbi:unnamed protein product [Oncorhynchus mykiss]|uniref:Chemokine interleukin-8-like domain-containing protein n=1 Tax=Oncorhynchus mykiss TaxID=8022 RepID=A0A060VUU9_ONCMY|nr:unnamed protein product [Oncorhynchus mykiss]
MQSVRIKHIQKLQGYPKTVFCGKTELIVTMRNGKTKCLNPDGKQGKQLLLKKRAEKQQKKPKGGQGRRNKIINILEFR